MIIQTFPLFCKKKMSISPHHYQDIKSSSIQTFDSLPIFLQLTIFHLQHILIDQRKDKESVRHWDSTPIINMGRDQ